MTKRTTTGALLVIGALVAAACGDGVLPSGPDFDAAFAKGGNKPAKFDVCHLDDEGVFKKINVSERARGAHIAHGDELPDDEDGSCPPPLVTVDPTITEASWTFEYLPPLNTTGLLNVTFSSSDCAGTDVTYQVVGVQDDDAKAATTGTGDGPFTIVALIPPVDPNTEFQVHGLCDNGVALSAQFTKPPPPLPLPTLIP